uniref:Uncharacterized protein n=1 Tax=Anguilla anguilla TaxID=7936 RepID=A0A0E9P787_ANGAN
MKTKFFPPTVKNKILSTRPAFFYSLWFLRQLVSALPTGRFPQ